MNTTSTPFDEAMPDCFHGKASLRIHTHRCAIVRMCMRTYVHAYAQLVCLHTVPNILSRLPRAHDAVTYLSRPQAKVSHARVIPGTNLYHLTQVRASLRACLAMGPELPHGRVRR